MGGILGDTWIFNGVEWSQKKVQTSPLPRVNASIAYDAARGEVVLFGGEIKSDRWSEQVNDTWIWYGEAWIQRFTDHQPMPRSGASMVYDQFRQEIVLFGGISGGGFLDDTWVWDGTKWSERYSKTCPSPRANSGFAYNQRKQYSALFGGQSFHGILNDTWIWDGNEWTRLETENTPPPQLGNFPSLSYDPIQQRVTLYGTIQEKYTNDNGAGDDLYQQSGAGHSPGQTEVSLSSPR